MRNPRLLLPVALPVFAALALGGCMRGDLDVAAAGANTDQGRGFFSSGSAYALQQKPAQQQAAARSTAGSPQGSADEEGRGFFSSGQTYASQPAQAQAYASTESGESSFSEGFSRLFGPPPPKLKSYVLQYHPPAKTESAAENARPPQQARQVAAAPPSPPAAHKPAPAAAAPQYTGSVTSPHDTAAAHYYAALPPASEGPYTLGAGDKLRVVVFGQAGISNTYIVDAGGNVSLPLIGSVAARGRTTQTLSHAITARLKQGYVRDPHVSVEIETYRPFFILGEVTTPGQYPYVAHMTAEMAVAIAGGYAPRAYKDDVVLTRNMPGGPVQMTVPPDTPLRPGDMVKIKERWF